MHTYIQYIHIHTHTYAHTHTHTCKPANKGQSQDIFQSIYPLVRSKYVTVQIKLYCVLTHLKKCPTTLKFVSEPLHILIYTYTHPYARTHMYTQHMHTKTHMHIYVHAHVHTYELPYKTRHSARIFFQLLVPAESPFS